MTVDDGGAIMKKPLLSALVVFAACALFSPAGASKHEPPFQPNGRQT
jgi:hypothetical protein